MIRNDIQLSPICRQWENLHSKIRREWFQLNDRQSLKCKEFQIRQECELYCTSALGGCRWHLRHVIFCKWWHLSQPVRFQNNLSKSELTYTLRRGWLRCCRRKIQFPHRRIRRTVSMHCYHPTPWDTVGHSRVPELRRLMNQAKIW